MKMTCIIGNPRNNGSCQYLMNTFLKGIHQEKVETRYYSISQMNIQYCMGCIQCYER